MQLQLRVRFFFFHPSKRSCVDIWHLLRRMPEASNRGVPVSAESAAASHVSEIKQHLQTLQADEAERVETELLFRRYCKRVKKKVAIDIEQAEADLERFKKLLATEIEQAEAELEAAVAAPVDGGADPTSWLPDELLIHIFLHVGRVEGCRLVCRRWRQLCETWSVKAAHNGILWEARWCKIRDEQRPQVLRDVDVNTHDDDSGPLCAGVNQDVIYCGFNDVIEVRSEWDGSLLRTLTGHASGVKALAVGSDGLLYSGSDDTTIRAWSEETGAHIRTLEGHTSPVYALVANETSLFSGSADGVVRVWQCSTGDFVRQLTDAGEGIHSLALDNRNQLFLPCLGGSIQVWSVTDYSLLCTLRGHHFEVLSMVFDRKGTLYSGSLDGTICAWSWRDDTPFKEVGFHATGVYSLAFAPHGMLFSASMDGAIQNLRLREYPVQMPDAISYGPYLIFTRTNRLWVASCGSLLIY